MFLIFALTVYATFLLTDNLRIISITNTEEVYILIKTGFDEFVYASIASDFQ